MSGIDLYGVVVGAILCLMGYFVLRIGGDDYYDEQAREMGRCSFVIGGALFLISTAHAIYAFI